MRAFAVAKGLNNVDSGDVEDDFEDGNVDDGFDEAYLDDDEGEWEDDEIPDDLDDLKDAIGQ